MIICCSRHATDHKAHSQHYVLRTHSDDAATAGLGLGAGCRLGTVAPIQTLRVLDSEAEIETAQLARPSRLPARYFVVQLDRASEAPGQRALGCLNGAGLP